MIPDSWKFWRRRRDRTVRIVLLIDGKTWVDITSDLAHLSATMNGGINMYEVAVARSTSPVHVRLLLAAQ